MHRRAATFSIVALILVAVLPPSAHALVIDAFDDDQGPVPASSWTSVAATVPGGVRDLVNSTSSDGAVEIASGAFTFRQPSSGGLDGYVVYNGDAAPFEEVPAQLDLDLLADGADAFAIDLISATDWFSISLDLFDTSGTPLSFGEPWLQRPSGGPRQIVLPFASPDEGTGDLAHIGFIRFNVVAAPGSEVSFGSLSTITAVPEPGSGLLLAVGLVAMARARAGRRG